MQSPSLSDHNVIENEMAVNQRIPERAVRSCFSVVQCEIVKERINVAVKSAS